LTPVRARGRTTSIVGSDDCAIAAVSKQQLSETTANEKILIPTAPAAEPLDCIAPLSFPRIVQGLNAISESLRASMARMDQGIVEK
jgi:hypothetical protein